MCRTWQPSPVEKMTRRAHFASIWKIPVVAVHKSMSYRVVIKVSAEKELAALPAHTRERIHQRILSLESDPRPRGAKKLQGQEAYRLRVGDYRVLYTVDDSARQVMVYAIGHRRDVYR